jgi:hypothetical protein
MKKKVVLTLAAIGVVISALKVESLYYQKQLQKAEAEKMDLLIENKIRFEELAECEAKYHNDVKLTKLLAEFKNFKN